jgi:WD40 repeat protein
MIVSKDWIKKMEIDIVNYQLYCCANTDLYIFDLNGKLVRQFVDIHKAQITCCVYSNKHRLVITGSADAVIVTSSLIGGGQMGVFRGHSKSITKLLLHPKNSDLIISSSLDSSIRIWSLPIMQQVFQ